MTPPNSTIKQSPSYQGREVASAKNSDVEQNTMVFKFINNDKSWETM
jgi:hypothetical protein